jgi:hypothetical protein
MNASETVNYEIMILVFAVSTNLTTCVVFGVWGMFWKFEIGSDWDAFCCGDHGILLIVVTVFDDSLHLNIICIEIVLNR